jgi:hypothetical protein
MAGERSNPPRTQAFAVRVFGAAVGADATPPASLLRVTTWHFAPLSHRRHVTFLRYAGNTSVSD